MALLVEVEFCKNCNLHNWNSHHDEVKYLDYYQQLARKIKQKIPNAKVMQRKPSEELVLRKIQANDGALYFNSETGQSVHFPRLGSFQVYVDGVRIFSKIKSKVWPKFDNVVEKLNLVIKAKEEGRNFLFLDVDQSDSQKISPIKNSDKYDIRAIFRVRKSSGKDETAIMHQTSGRQGFRQRQLQRSLDVEKGVREFNPQNSDIVFEQAVSKNQKQKHKKWLQKWNLQPKEDYKSKAANVYLQQLYPRAASRRRKLVISKIDSTRILLQNEKGERIAYRKEVQIEDGDRKILESGASSARASSRRNNRRKLAPIGPAETNAKINTVNQNNKDLRYEDLYDELNLSQKQRQKLQQKQPREEIKPKRQEEKKITQKEEYQYDQQEQFEKQEQVPKKKTEQHQTKQKQQNSPQIEEQKKQEKKKTEKAEDQYAEEYEKLENEEEYSNQFIVENEQVEDIAVEKESDKEAMKNKEQIEKQKKQQENLKEIERQKEIDKQKQIQKKKEEERQQQIIKQKQAEKQKQIQKQKQLQKQKQIEQQKAKLEQIEKAKQKQIEKQKELEKEALAEKAKADMKVQISLNYPQQKWKTRYINNQYHLLAVEDVIKEQKKVQQKAVHQQQEIIPVQEEIEVKEEVKFQKQNQSQKEDEAKYQNNEFKIQQLKKQDKINLGNEDKVLGKNKQDQQIKEKKDGGAKDIIQKGQSQIVKQHINAAIIKVVKQEEIKQKNEDGFEPSKEIHKGNKEAEKPAEHKEAEDTKPAQHKEAEKPVQHKEAKDTKPVQHKEAEKPVQHKEAEKPVQHKEAKDTKPAQHKEAEKPVQHKEAEKPAENKEAEKPVQHKEAEKPAENKEAEKPVQHQSQLHPQIPKQHPQEPAHVTPNLSTQPLLSAFDFINNYPITKWQTKVKDQQCILQQHFEQKLHELVGIVTETELHVEQKQSEIHIQKQKKKTQQLLTPDRKKQQDHIEWQTTCEKGQYKIHKVDKNQQK